MKFLDRTSGLDLYDFDARAYDPSIGRFRQPDPLAEGYQPLSPYLYCAANPLARIDPTGMADFWHEGELIGNDGVNDNRIYVIRNANASYGVNEVVVKGAGLGKKEINRTVKFIKKHNTSGSQSVIAESDWVYNNCIEIEPSAKNRQKMVDIVSQDNGKGGTDNNQEHGGYIDSQGTVVKNESGPVSNPLIDKEASISNNMGVSSFHCHNSGTRTTVEATTTGFRSMETTDLFSKQTMAMYMQHPSPTDIELAGNHTHYVFAMRERKVYIYILKMGFRL